jgi:hypothetical protein
MEETKLKRITLFAALTVIGLALTLVPANTTRTAVQAQEAAALTPQTYIPLVIYPQTRYVERFVADPEWHFEYLKNDPKDGYFEHSPETETYLGYITDNSGLFIAWPEWRASGDYILEVSARHVGPNRKSFNGLGIAFNIWVSKTDPARHQFHALMLAAGGAQHNWAVVRFDDSKATYLTNDGYRGGPPFMSNWDKWNDLEVRVIDGEISVYCNGKWLPAGTATDKRLVDNRLVGLVVSSYEFSNGLVEFDNFKLTLLLPGDPRYQEEMRLREERAARSAREPVEFVTLPMDLHD